MQAACGLGQLKKLPFYKKRNYNFNYLLKKFRKLEEFFILPEKTKIRNHHGLVSINIRENKYFNRNELIRFLEQKKIHSSSYLQECYKATYMNEQKYRVQEH